MKLELMSGAKNRTWLKVFKGVVGLPNRRLHPLQPGNSLSLILQETWWEEAGDILWTELTREATDTAVLETAVSGGKV